SHCGLHARYQSRCPHHQAARNLRLIFRVLSFTGAAGAAPLHFLRTDVRCRISRKCFGNHQRLTKAGINTKQKAATRRPFDLKTSVSDGDSSSCCRLSSCCCSFYCCFFSCWLFWLLSSQGVFCWPS